MCEDAQKSREVELRLTASPLPLYGCEHMYHATYSATAISTMAMAMCMCRFVSVGCVKERL